MRDRCGVWRCIAMSRQHRQCRAAHLIAGDMHDQLALGRTQSTALCDLPPRIACGLAREPRMCGSKRLEGNDASGVTAIAQFARELSGVGADIEDQLNSVCREHAGQAPCRSGLGPVPADVQSKTLQGAAQAVLERAIASLSHRPYPSGR